MADNKIEENNQLLRNQSKGVMQGTNVMGNLFSLADMLQSSAQSFEDMEKIHERQKKPASPYIFFIHMDYTADDNPGISVHFTVQKDMGAFFILAHAASQTFC